MTRFVKKIISISLLFSLCLSILLGACTCRTAVGFEPNGAYHVREVLIDEEGNGNSGVSYYQDTGSGASAFSLIIPGTREIL